MSSTAKILLSVAAIQFGVIPLIVDFGETHVFHPDWPPHARFHLVWLLTAGALLAASVLYGVWIGSRRDPALGRPISLVGCIVLAAFFVAALARPTYGGSLSDAAEPILVWGVDGNVFSFAIAAVLQAAGTVLVWRTPPG